MIITEEKKKSDDLQQKTKSAYLLLQLITQCCHGVTNTQFIAPDPKPDWFDDLNDKLDIAKSHSTHWIDDIAPDITSGVPLQVIDYGTTYDALTDEIVNIADAHPDASGKDNKYVKEVHALVSALHSSVKDIVDNADEMAKNLTDWGDSMQASHDDLSTGAASIQSAETDLATDISKMNAAMETLRQEIASENKAIAASAGAVGGGVFLLVVGIALAPVSGGTSLVVGGIGGALIIGGAVTWGVMQAKIDKQFKEIAEDQKELDDDKRQLVALQGLASASKNALDYIDDATTALSEFRTSWSGFEGELKQVLAKLEKAEDSLQIIVSKAFTVAAKKEWAIATKYAEDLQNAPVDLPAKVLQMSS